MSEKFIIRSATIDHHGDYTSLNVLENTLIQLNGEEKIRYLVNHRRDIPPVGYFDNGEIKEVNSVHHLFMEPIAFQNRTSISWDSTLLSEDGGKYISFIKKEYNDLFQISVDKNNFSNTDVLNEIGRKLNDINEGEIVLELGMRKSLLPDPQIVFTLASFYSLLKPLLSKMGEKFAEEIADDLYKTSKSNFKKIINKVLESARILRKDMIPKNKILHTIFEIPGMPYIELHVKSDEVNRIEKGLRPSNLLKVHKKVASLQRQLNIGEIHFVLNAKDNWDLSYLITEEGKIIGTKTAFNKRDKLFERIQLSPTKAFSVGADSVQYDKSPIIR
ncbi:hypothetical protein CMU30_06885 [Elizabethkingia anophelis]|nr:hypothetical protein [Elizabethkingia anophelis]MDV3684141.1 hypothetical protein [Elizabethkingia anophelis]MDV3700969.1 hypothetical protein [Elizabethkingia anophelis]MDV3763125.1 hypothetical protein [Elizabethkingia anophelis]MDV3801265.1 hypothetical protein [Elizabethkingia anophelis]